MNRLVKTMLVGLGYDSKDGHIRVAKGKNFRIFGGSEKTHEMMLDKMMEFNRHLDKRSKTLDEISEKEFCQIAKYIGLKIKKKEERGEHGKDSDR